MTDEKARTLGLRAVACEAWRWRPGMLWWEREGLPDRVSGDGEWSGPWGAAVDGWPDFRDPATLGCLVGLVREAWGGEMVYSDPYGAGWRVQTVDNARRPCLCGVGRTDAEAWVDALANL